MYSVQQLLFDSMSYLKEFHEEGALWHVSAIGPDLHGLEGNYAVWLHRPALSLRAAETVTARLVSRFGVRPMPQGFDPGRFIFLGKASVGAAF